MRKRKTHEEYVAELLEKRGYEFEVIENYETNAKKIMHRCSKCSHEWRVSPINILRGQSCPGCRNKSLSTVRKKTKEQYTAEVLEVHGDNIEVIGTYKGARNTTEHKCNSCKNIWEAAPTNILKGKGEKHYVKVIT
ncbi:zinc-ribbon domain-containing protein [Bacillus mycoides]|uniref:zinc-ribbon domain-containing protein n=1 Tax=Bacillus mycoides TaxID=1405 RepID=UPI003F7B6A7D